jgi:hypothetical protein
VANVRLVWVVSGRFFFLSLRAIRVFTIFLNQYCSMDSVIHHPHHPLAGLDGHTAFESYAGGGKSFSWPATSVAGGWYAGAGG